MDNKLSGEFCIAFVAQANVNNDQPLLQIYDITQTTQKGSILMSSNSLQITLGGSSASFDTAIVEDQHYQLCYNGSVMTLYDDCIAVDTMPFAPFAEFLETDLFYLLAGPTGTPFSVSPFF